MKKSIENIRHTFHMMWWSWQFIRSWRISFILCSLISITQNAWMSVTSAYLIGQTTEFAATGNWHAMVGTIGLVAVIIAIDIVMITAVNYFTSKINILGLAQLRKTLFAKLNAMTAANAEKQLSGDLMTRLSMDAEHTTTFFSTMMTGNRSIFSIPVSILIAVTICIVRLPIVGIGSLLFLLAGIYLNLACIRREYTMQAKRMTVLSALTQHMVDMIYGSVVARMFGVVARKQAQHDADAAIAYSYAKRGARYNAARSSMSSAIQWGSIVYTLVAGSYFVHRGAADVGTVVFIVLMQSQINNDVLLLTNLYQQLQQATVSATRIKDILDQPEEVERGNMTIPDLNHEVAVRFDRVTVSYEPNHEVAVPFDRVTVSYEPNHEVTVPVDNVTVSYETNQPALKDVSLTVKNGERLAIVGGSGGGKTTLMKTILEFTQVNQGSLTLYGYPREQYSQTAIRKLSAYVPQNCTLLDGTIGENIAWGNKDATKEIVRSAAYDAGLGELIENSPLGLDTRVGEQGVALSGGQRQRIAIARAMVKDAPLLLLDEATSALDGESEKSVQLALERLMQGRTTIVIAHRLSTIQNADRIIVMEHGEIVEEGRHSELLSQGALYARLYRLQYSMIPPSLAGITSTP
jgi:ABC-type multidrug transport system fused ATPase/permease subunit